jgi:translation initiation factor IF-1
MSKQDMLKLEGRVTEVLPGTMFRVSLDNGHNVLAHVGGKMRKHFVRLVAGDRVSLEMSPYDLDKARIVYRLDPNRPIGPIVPVVTPSAPSPQAQA